MGSPLLTVVEASEIEIMHCVEALLALADRIEARFQAAQSRIRGITHWRLACGFKVEL